jgi:hypothetical protein
VKLNCDFTKKFQTFALCIILLEQVRLRFRKQTHDHFFRHDDRHQLTPLPFRFEWDQHRYRSLAYNMLIIFGLKKEPHTSEFYGSLY